eukprot:3940560-Rhodomonas_salina.1
MSVLRQLISVLREHIGTEIAYRATGSVRREGREREGTWSAAASLSPAPARTIPYPQYRSIIADAQYHHSLCSVALYPILSTVAS